MPYSFRRISLQKLARLVDLAVIGLAFLTGLVVSSASFTWLSLTLVLAARIKVINLLLLLGYLAFCSLIFSAHGFYRSRRSLRWQQRISRIVLAVTLITSALFALSWPFDFSFATGSFLVVFWFLSCSILILAHEISRRLQSIARLHGRLSRNVVVVGEGERAKNLAVQIAQDSTLGYRIIRIITTEQTEVYHGHSSREQRGNNNDDVRA